MCAVLLFPIQLQICENIFSVAFKITTVFSQTALEEWELQSVAIQAVGGVMFYLFFGLKKCAETETRYGVTPRVNAITSMVV